MIFFSRTVLHVLPKIGVAHLILCATISNENHIGALYCVCSEKNRGVLEKFGCGLSHSGT